MKKCFLDSVRCLSLSCPCLWLFGFTCVVLTRTLCRMNIVSILECVTLMDFDICVVEGVHYDMESYQVFACVALVQPGSSTMHCLCENLFFDLI